MKRNINKAALKNQLTPEHPYTMKQICSALNISEPKDVKSRHSLLEELSKHCNIERRGPRYIIHQIYEGKTQEDTEITHAGSFRRRMESYTQNDPSFWLSYKQFAEIYFGMPYEEMLPTSHMERYFSGPDDIYYRVEWMGRKIKTKFDQMIETDMAYFKSLGHSYERHYVVLSDKGELRNADEAETEVIASHFKKEGYGRKDKSEEEHSQSIKNLNEKLGSISGSQYSCKAYNIVFTSAPKGKGVYTEQGMVLKLRADFCKYVAEYVYGWMEDGFPQKIFYQALFSHWQECFMTTPIGYGSKGSYQIERITGTDKFESMFGYEAVMHTNGKYMDTGHGYDTGFLEGIFDDVMDIMSDETVDDLSDEFTDEFVDGSSDNSPDESFGKSPASSAGDAGGDVEMETETETETEIPNNVLYIPFGLIRKEDVIAIKKLARELIGSNSGSDSAGRSDGSDGDNGPKDSGPSLSINW